jgi:hypothetical protein
MSDPKSRATPTRSISTRVTFPEVDQIDALKPLYPGANGDAAYRSDVLRAFIEMAMPVVGDPALHRELQQRARARGVTPGEVLREIVVRGLGGAAQEKP